MFSNKNKRDIVSKNDKKASLEYLFTERPQTCLPNDWSSFTQGQCNTAALNHPLLYEEALNECKQKGIMNPTDLEMMEYVPPHLKIIFPREFLFIANLSVHEFIERCHKNKGYGFIFQIIVDFMSIESIEPHIPVFTEYVKSSDGLTHGLPLSMSEAQIEQGLINGEIYEVVYTPGDRFKTYTCPSTDFEDLDKFEMPSQAMINCLSLFSTIIDRNKDRDDINFSSDLRTDHLYPQHMMHSEVETTREAILETPRKCFIYNVPTMLIDAFDHLITWRPTDT